MVVIEIILGLLMMFMTGYCAGYVAEQKGWVTKSDLQLPKLVGVVQTPTNNADFVNEGKPRRRNPFKRDNKSPKKAQKDL